METNAFATNVFEKSKPIIGVLQLLPLPGSVSWKGKIHPVIARAEQEATALATGGVDAIMVENTYDAPYTTGRLDTAGAIAIGLIIRRIMHFTHVPIGINVLRNDPQTALAIAMNVGAKFIRVSLLTGVAVCESGLLEGKHRELAEYKNQLQVEGIKVFADISLDNTAPLVGGNASVSLRTLARQAIDVGGADGIVVCDRNITPQQLAELSDSIDAPVFYDYPHIIAEAEGYLRSSDGLFVASPLKKSSVVAQDLMPTVDLTKVEELTAMAEMIRSPEPVSL